MEKELASEIFDSCLTTLLAHAFILVAQKMVVSATLFRLLTYPLEPISNGRSTQV